MDTIQFLLAICGGTVTAGILACLPLPHVFFAVWGSLSLIGLAFFSGETLAAFMLASVVSYAFLHTISAVFWRVPDEAALLMLRPGRNKVDRGQGRQATALVGIGALGASLVMALIVPLSHPLLPGLRHLLTPHLYWIFTAVFLWILFFDLLKPMRFEEEDMNSRWKRRGAALLVLFLAGSLGWILFHRPLNPARYTFLPALLGLLVIPELIRWVIFPPPAIVQDRKIELDVEGVDMIQGVAWGTGSGLMSVVLPILAGPGMSSLMAHLATGKGSKIQLVAQGASRLSFYLGAFLLLVVPGLSLTPSGLDWMVAGEQGPMGWTNHYFLMSAILISAGLSFFLLLLAGYGAAWTIESIPPRFLASVALVGVIGGVFYATGVAGLVILAASTGVGALLLAYRCSPSCALAALLFPWILQGRGLDSWLVSLLGM